MRKTIGAVISLLAAPLAGCASTVTLGNVPECSRLISASGLLNPTPGAEIPEGDAVAWRIGFLEQSGQLQKANDDKAGAAALMTECETMHRDALKRSTRRFLGIF